MRKCSTPNSRGVRAISVPSRRTVRLGRVEGEVPRLEHRRAGRRAAADERAQPRDQHEEGERLGEVVVGAEVERVGLVVLAVLGGQHEHRCPDAAGPQPPADLVAVEPGQHDVEDDDVVVVRPVAVNRPSAPSCTTSTTKPSAARPRRTFSASADLVLHQQHPHAVLLPRPVWPRPYAVRPFDAVTSLPSGRLG